MARHRSVSGSSGGGGSDDSPLLRALKSPARVEELRDPVRPAYLGEAGGSGDRLGPLGGGSGSGAGGDRTGSNPRQHAGGGSYASITGPRPSQTGAELRDVTGGVDGNSRWRPMGGMVDEEDEEIIMSSGWAADLDKEREEQSRKNRRRRCVGLLVIFIGLVVVIWFVMTLVSTPVSVLEEHGAGGRGGPLLHKEHLHKQAAADKVLGSRSVNLLPKDHLTTGSDSLFPGVPKKPVVENMDGDIWTGGRGAAGGPKTSGLSSAVQDENAKKNDPDVVNQLLREAGQTAPVAASAAQKRSREESHDGSAAKRSRGDESWHVESISEELPGKRADKLTMREGVRYVASPDRDQPLSNDKAVYRPNPKVNYGQPELAPLKGAVVDFKYYWEMPDMEKLVQSGAESKIVVPKS